MASSSGSVTSPVALTAPRRRQRPGAACEECRRRKLRCDGQQPQCGVCQESGVRCEVTTQRAIRGPKKGYMKALRSRVAMLEDRLLAQQRDGLSGVPASCTPSTTAMQPLDLATTAFADDGLPTLDGSVSEAEAFLPSPAHGTDSLSELSTVPSAKIRISDIEHAELDQLYFDRIHPSIPILQQRRYLSWSNKPGSKFASRACLQHAMWTIASLMSAQFQHLQKGLYRDTKLMLEALSLSGNRKSLLESEQVQAWILVATYESMRTYHQQAWMSAGRAFRLVQLMRLHEIDSPANSVATGADFIETEEKRRVFWMAYFLDHLFSMRNNWPITLNEHVICTRLPSADADFQSGQHVVGSFLSEAITETTPSVRSAFNESLIFATICGRSMFYWQQHNIRCAYGDDALDSTVQHRWLNDILENRLRILSQYYPSPNEAYDPMLLFTNIIAQATVIYICKGVNSMTVPEDRERGPAQGYEERALAAAGKIITLAKVLKDFHVFKVHPLTPMPLLMSVEFLYTNSSTNEGFSSQLHELLAVFRQLKNVNNHKESYFTLLELSCTVPSAELTRGNGILSKQRVDKPHEAF